LWRNDGHIFIADGANRNRKRLNLNHVDNLGHGVGLRDNRA
jgi:hypothetical protein